MRRAIILFVVAACRLALGQEGGPYDAIPLQDVTPEEAFTHPASEEEAAPPPDSQPPAPKSDNADISEVRKQSEPAPVADRPGIPEPEPADAGHVIASTLEDIVQFFGPAEPGARDNLSLTTGIRTGYDDNVFTTETDRIASAFQSIYGTLDYHFGTERLDLALQASGGATYFENRPGDSTDLNGGASIRMKYIPSRRLSSHFAASIQYLSQPDPMLIGNVLRFSGDFSVTSVQFDVSYNLRPRLSMTAGYQFSGVRYADEAANQQLGFYDQTFSLSTNYLLFPRASFVVEYRYNPVLYYEIDQGSDGHLLLFGYDYTVGPKMLWTLRGGAEQRSVKDASNAETSSYLGPFVESQVSYNYLPDSSLSLNARYGTEPSGIANLAIRQTFRVWLNVNHSFTGHLSGNAAIYYQNDNYDQPGDINDFSQALITGVLGLSYQIGPSFSVFGRYEYSNLVSDTESSDYTRNVTSVGVELVF